MGAGRSGSGAAAALRWGGNAIGSKTFLLLLVLLPGIAGASQAQPMGGTTAVVFPRLDLGGPGRSHRLVDSCDP